MADKNIIAKDFGRGVDSTPTMSATNPTALPPTPAPPPVDPLADSKSRAVALGVSWKNIEPAVAAHGPVVIDLAERLAGLGHPPVVIEWLITHLAPVVLEILLHFAAGHHNTATLMASGQDVKAPPKLSGAVIDALLPFFLHNFAEPLVEKYADRLFHIVVTDLGVPAAKEILAEIEKIAANAEAVVNPPAQAPATEPVDSSVVPPQQ